MKKFFRSFNYALHGIAYCFKNEQNFRVHFFSAVVVVVAAALFHCSNLEWLVILLCIGSVLSLEMLNTAIEKLCDRISGEFDPKIKIIKDVSAGAVLVAAVIAAICGAIIFVSKIISLFNLLK